MQTYVYIYIHIHIQIHIHLCIYIYILHTGHGHVWESRSQATRISWNEQHHVLPNLQMIGKGSMTRNWETLGKQSYNCLSQLPLQNMPRPRNKGHDYELMRKSLRYSNPKENQTFEKAKILLNFKSSSSFLSFFRAFTKKTLTAELLAKEMGFTDLWLPPCSQSVAPQADPNAVDVATLLGC